jgi:hypothetical protein
LGFSSYYLPGNLIKTLIRNKKYILEFFIRYKAWPDLVVMFSLLSLTIEFLGDIEIGQLGWFDNFSVDFEGKCAEVFIVDSSSCLDVFPNVFSKGLDDEMELSFRVKGFGSLICTGLRLKVLAGVVIGVLDNPINDET